MTTKYEFKKTAPSSTESTKKHTDDLVRVRYFHKLVTYKGKDYLVTERVESVWKPMSYVEKVVSGTPQENDTTTE